MQVECCQHSSEIKLLRTELKNVRDQIRGLRIQHRKEVENLKKLLDFHPKNELQKKSKIDQNEKSIIFKPIAFASTWHKTKNGTPRQGNLAKKVDGVLDLVEARKYHQGLENPQYALQGLQQFSHLWILFHFHQNNADGKNYVKTKVAPPRLNGEKVGLFSTRTPHRPNAIGLTLAKLIDIQGSKVFLQGLDLIDKTPIIDIKPYIPTYDIPKTLDSKEEMMIDDENIEFPSWIEESQGLIVSFTPRACQDLEKMPALQSLKSKQDLKEAIVNVLQEDPRSNYRKDKCLDRLYFFNVDQVKITCWFDDNNLAEVLRIKSLL